jgi:hypothetical protein
MKTPVEGQFSLRLIEERAYGSWSWLKDHDERIGIALELSEAINLDGFPASKFFLVKSITNSSIPNVLVIVCQEPIFFDIFEILCKDLVATSANSESLEDAISLLKDRLNSWIQLFKRMKQLSLKDVYGLVAELKFLEIWIANGQQIDTWLGPHQSPQDFISPSINLAVEIKATSVNHNAIAISSLEQLDFQGKLFLVTYPIVNSSAENPMSISLNGLISSIKQKLTPQFIPIFDSKVSLLGYSRDQEICDFLLEVGDPVIYLVTQGFPKVLKTDVLGGVLSCKYEISITDCQQFQISKKRLLEEIRP